MHSSFPKPLYIPKLYVKITIYPMSPQSNNLLSFHEHALLRASIGGDAFISTRSLLSNLIPNGREDSNFVDPSNATQSHRLIMLRREMIADAQARGDHDEVRRLESLSIFDKVATVDSDSSRDSKAATQNQAHAIDERPELRRKAQNCVQQYSLHVDKSPSGSPKGDALAKGLAEEAKTFFNLICTPSTSSIPSSPSSPGHLPVDLIHPAVKAAYESILNLSKSPVIINFLNDAMLLAEHETGLCEPGLAELESLGERIDNALRTQQFEEFERANEIFGDWEKEEWARRGARLTDAGRKGEEEVMATKRSDRRSGEGHIAWWDGFSASAAGKKEDKTPNKTVRASRFHEML